MAENSKNEIVGELMAHVAHLADSRGIPIGQLSKAAGVSPAFLQSCLAGTRNLAPTRMVQLCREAGIAFPVVAEVLKGFVDRRNYFRISTAAKPYECSYCGTGIRKESQYVRLEPFGPTRQSGAPVQYFCRPCAVSAKWLQELSPDASNSNEIQLELPLWALIKPTTVQLVDVSATLCERIAADPRELFELSPPRFEALILDRLSAMDFVVYPVGHTYKKDGGIDIIFTPPKSYPFPFLGAAQVKHHRNIDRKVGPAPVRELAGVMVWSFMNFLLKIKIKIQEMTVRASKGAFFRWAYYHQHFIYTRR
jgi:hypothetical protein